MSAHIKPSTPTHLHLACEGGVTQHMTEGASASSHRCDPLPPHPLLQSPHFLDNLHDPAMSPSLICQLHDITLDQLAEITATEQYQRIANHYISINTNRRTAICEEIGLQAIAALRDVINDATVLTEQETKRAPTLIETRRKAVNDLIKACAGATQPAQPTDTTHNSQSQGTSTPPPKSTRVHPKSLRNTSRTKHVAHHPYHHKAKGGLRMIAANAHQHFTRFLTLTLAAGAMLTSMACSSSQPTANTTNNDDIMRARTAAYLTPERYDARLTGVTYPFPVKNYPFDAQRQHLEMAYMDIMPEEPNGQTVLLLHGKNFNAASWEETARDLRDQGYRVIMPDQIGFGKSTKPEKFQFTFSALATYTNNLLNHIDAENVTVVGHSMGGMIASRFAMMFPDRTDKLVLVNPIGLEDWQHVVPYTPVEKWYANELKKTPEGVKAYMRESYFDGNWEDEYDNLAKLQMNWTQSPDKHQLAWVSALTYDMIFTQPVIHDFDQIQVPTLLIIGTRDRTALGKNLVSDEVRATLGQYQDLGKHAQSLIPDAQLVEIEAVGHIPQVEAYDTYFDALSSFIEN